MRGVDCEIVHVRTPEVLQNSAADNTSGEERSSAVVVSARRHEPSWGVGMLGIDERGLDMLRAAQDRERGSQLVIAS